MNHDPPPPSSLQLFWPYWVMDLTIQLCVFALVILIFIVVICGNNPQWIPSSPSFVLQWHQYKPNIKSFLLNASHITKNKTVPYVI